MIIQFQEFNWISSILQLYHPILVMIQGLPTVKSRKCTLGSCGIGMMPGGKTISFFIFFNPHSDAPLHFLSASLFPHSHPSPPSLFPFYIYFPKRKMFFCFTCISVMASIPKTVPLNNSPYFLTKLPV
jgi:hypothetical protein